MDIHTTESEQMHSHTSSSPTSTQTTSQLTGSQRGILPAAWVISPKRVNSQNVVQASEKPAPNAILPSATTTTVTQEDKRGSFIDINDSEEKSVDILDEHSLVGFTMPLKKKEREKKRLSDDNWTKIKDSVPERKERKDHTFRVPDRKEHKHHKHPQQETEEKTNHHSHKRPRPEVSNTPMKRQRRQIKHYAKRRKTDGGDTSESESSKDLIILDEVKPKEKKEIREAQEIKSTIESDYELAKRLQAEEEERARRVVFPSPPSVLAQWGAIPTHPRYYNENFREYSDSDDLPFPEVRRKSRRNRQPMHPSPLTLSSEVDSSSSSSSSDLSLHEEEDWDWHDDSDYDRQREYLEEFQEKDYSEGDEDGFVVSSLPKERKKDTKNKKTRTKEIKETKEMNETKETKETKEKRGETKERIIVELDDSEIEEKEVKEKETKKRKRERSKSKPKREDKRPRRGGDARQDRSEEGRRARREEREEMRARVTRSRSLDRREELASRRHRSPPGLRLERRGYNPHHAPAPLIVNEFGNRIHHRHGPVHYGLEPFHSFQHYGGPLGSPHLQAFFRRLPHPQHVPRSNDPLFNLQFQDRDFNADDYEMLLQLDKNNVKKTGAAAIKKIRAKKLNDLSELEGNGEAQKTCSICLEDYEIGCVYKKLPCSHIYHTECIDAWLKEARQCPVCKKDVTQ